MKGDPAETAYDRRMNVAAQHIARMLPDGWVPKPCRYESHRASYYQGGDPGGALGGIVCGACHPSSIKGVDVSWMATLVPDIEELARA